MKILLRTILTSYIFFSLGCGSQKDQVVKGFRYDIREDYLNLRVDFNSSTELNLETTIPVKKYGFVHLIPGGEDVGFTIGFDLDLNIIHGKDIIDLRKTRKLPNGMPMSRYVDTELARLKLKKTDKFSTSLYVGPNEKNIYLGLDLELAFMDDDFPAGLVLSQWVRDNYKRPLGVVTLYGPKLRNGRVESPGGIFIVTNVNDLVSYLEEEKSQSYQSFLSQNTMEVGSPLEIYNESYAHIFQNQENIRDLWDLFKFKANDSGLID